jgi:hypothetical protein
LVKHLWVSPFISLSSLASSSTNSSSSSTSSLLSSLSSHISPKYLSPFLDSASPSTLSVDETAQFLSTLEDEIISLCSVVSSFSAELDFQSRKKGLDVTKPNFSHVMSLHFDPTGIQSLQRLSYFLIAKEIHCALSCIAGGLFNLSF